ncbi:MAG TPA: PP2C family protein-serine/threonine phosphatase [Candidatus Eisenbergiella merdavium]|uniref:PP2C family protein-serine/threonine phosphatase n=1 Tax=Candidatus Eisenbergiella merdavium TaxID=2838551 RepID=A0A9D2NDN7_9FIRM|nr:PP2C family protein-serine/threonine phosphatase [Candidatus Eisenbergiella merdavium]
MEKVERGRKKENRGVNTEEKMERNALRLGLAFKFIAGLCVAGLLIMAGTAAVGVSTYWNSITRQYNEMAYQVARTASGYFSREELSRYADAVYRYCTGETGRDEIDAIAESERYLQIKGQLDGLRESMEANDIFVFVFDIDLLRNFDQEAYDKMEWNPIYYISDSYHVKEQQFSIGDESSVLKEYVKDCIQAYETGVHADNYFISEGEFGYNTSAMYPVVQDGRTVAFVGVEIPMSTLQGNVRSYLVRITLVGSLITLVLLAVVAWLLTRTLIAPVKQVAQAASLFTENRNMISDALRTIRTGDEVQMLAESVLKMEQDINAYIENLTRVTAEKERIGAELDVAARIQANMLPGIFPPFPDRKEIDIYATMTPAKEVGGDFYDFFLVDDDHLALVMADVSGKGVPAALFMVIAKTLLKNRAQMGVSPKEVLESVNNQLCENNESEMFVTVWLGVYQLSTGRLVAANAGHEYPAVRHAEGGFELLKDRHGFVLAGMENSRYREYELTLLPGEAIFVYTDGVAEATDTDNRLFGTDRMLLSLNRRPEATAQELLAQVKEDIDRFVGAAPQFDDITMLCLVNRNDTLMKKFPEREQPEKRLQKTEQPKTEGAGKEHV